MQSARAHFLRLLTVPHQKRIQKHLQSLIILHARDQPLRDLGLKREALVRDLVARRNGPQIKGLGHQEVTNVTRLQRPSKMTAKVRLNH